MADGDCGQQRMLSIVVTQEASASSWSPVTTALSLSGVSVATINFNRPLNYPLTSDFSSYREKQYQPVFVTLPANWNPETHFVEVVYNSTDNFNANAAGVAGIYEVDQLYSTCESSAPGSYGLCFNDDTETFEQDLTSWTLTSEKKETTTAAKRSARGFWLLVKATPTNAAVRSLTLHLRAVQYQCGPSQQVALASCQSPTMSLPTNGPLAVDQSSLGWAEFFLALIPLSLSAEGVSTECINAIMDTVCADMLPSCVGNTILPACKDICSRFSAACSSLSGMADWEIFSAAGTQQQETCAAVLPRSCQAVGQEETTGVCFRSTWGPSSEGSLSGAVPTAVLAWSSVVVAAMVATAAMMVIT